ncbi:MAG: hypothetical protein JWQ11_1835 [Rhizobacter sp.]|nr:hypothetical protein [Rhizobacter sp.]
MSTSIPRWAAAAVFAAIAPFTSLAQASTVLTFDDVAFAGAVPSNYGGLDWSAGGWIAFDGEQAPYTAHSGDWRVATDFGSSDAASRVSFASAVNFEGAWFSGYAEADVTFELFYQGAQVGTSSTLLPSDVPTFLSAGYGGLVDAVIVSSSNQAFFAMDDFTYTAATVSPVPEPETYALMLLGLGAVALAARRRNK